MVNCQGCGEETSSRLCCPKCSEYGRTSFFCSQECFVSSWPSHSKLHVIIRQIAVSTKLSSSYEACSSQGFSADETVAVSPATTAASVSANGEESLFHKKSQPALTSAHSVETRSRGRLLSRAQSETELPVVSSSAASSSFSRASAVAPSSSSSSREPPVLSTASAASPDAEIPAKIVPFDGSGDNREEPTAGGVLTAVRSLLLPRTRDKTEEKAQGGRPAFSATGAAARVTEAVRSVFSTSHNSHYVVPCGNRKKDGELVVAGREASGRSSTRGSTAVASSAAFRFCRCVVLALICVFCLFFMWVMRRVLFEGTGSSSSYLDEVAANRNEALSDSNDIVNTVLARIGARPYGEEISALQASVQDIRNELAAVTTLVQQHGVVIDQFIEKPNFSGRRQGGGGGAINQAISAFLEGGPPLPDAPQLKLPVVTSAVAVSDGKGAGGLSEAAQQEAVANPHLTVRSGGFVAAGGSAGANPGVSAQKFYEANVTMEGDRAKTQATAQQPLPDSTPKEQHLQTNQTPQANGYTSAEWLDNAAGEKPLRASSLNAAVESASYVDYSGSAHQAETLLHPDASGVKLESPSANVHTDGSIREPNDTVDGSSTVEQQGKAVNFPVAQAAAAYIHASDASDGQDIRQKELFTRTLEGEVLTNNSGSRGTEEQGSKANAPSNKMKEQYGMRRWHAFRGNQDGVEGNEEESFSVGDTATPHKSKEVSRQSNGLSALDSMGLGGATGRGVKRAKRS